jgi:hypothetical protein
MKLDITDYITSLIDSHMSLDLAEAEFKRIIADDHELRQLYREWCQENGSSERNGFNDYAEEYLSGREAVWETLSDYDDQE